MYLTYHSGLDKPNANVKWNRSCKEEEGVRSNFKVVTAGDIFADILKKFVSFNR
jgi:3-keto-L-gulonate-6-phosphate decarboxylase